MYESMAIYRNLTHHHYLYLYLKRLITMSEEGTYKVWLRLTNAAMVAVILFGTSAILMAVGYLLKTIGGT